MCNTIKNNFEIMHHLKSYAIQFIWILCITTLLSVARAFPYSLYCSILLSFSLPLTDSLARVVPILVPNDIYSDKFCITHTDPSTQHFQYRIRSLKMIVVIVLKYDEKQKRHIGRRHKYTACSSYTTADETHQN